LLGVAGLLVHLSDVMLVIIGTSIGTDGVLLHIAILTTQPLVLQIWTYITIDTGSIK
jgi:hypothetical protein